MSKTIHPEYEVQDYFGFKLARLDETLAKEQKQFAKENMIVHNFNLKFPELRVDTHDAFLLLINIKREVQVWHTQINRAFTVVNEVSEELLEAGLELEDWEQYLSEREQIKIIRKEFTLNSERMVRAHKLAMSKLVESTEKMVAERSDINTILSLGQDHLDSSTLRKMVSITNADQRRTALKKAVNSMRAERFKQWKETGIVPGKGK